MGKPNNRINLTGSKLSKVGSALDMGHFNWRTLRLEKSDHGKTPTH